MNLEKLDYEQLEKRLRNWVSAAGSDGPYDFVGMFHLFRACVLNLMEHSSREDWECIQEFLKPEERDFLRRVAGDGDPGSG